MSISARVSPLTSYPLLPINDKSILGTFTFTQTGQSTDVNIHVSIDNISDGTHALHINTYGDISNGALTTEPLFCKLQDIEAVNGKVNQTLTENAELISLFPGNKYIIGKAVVVYAAGSSSTVGGIGQPIAWGVIGLSSGE